MADDFSFPRLSHDPAHLITLTPSLWRITSRIYSCYEYHGEDDSKWGKCIRMNLEGAISEGGNNDDAEERMDMLWEDFNEEEKGLKLLDAATRQNNNKSQVVKSTTSKNGINLLLVLKAMKKLLSLHSMSQLNRSGL